MGQRLNAIIVVGLCKTLVLHNSKYTEMQHCLWCGYTIQMQALIAEGLAVEVVFTVTRANTLQIGDVSRNLLDGLNLLAKELPLDEV